MDRFAGKIDFAQKEPLKTAFLGWQKWTPLSLRGAGGQTVHNRSTLGVPLKTYGHNASNELCGRSVASKLWPQQANGLFYQGETEMSENLHFYKTLRTQKCSTWKFFEGSNRFDIFYIIYRYISYMVWEYLLGHIPFPIGCGFEWAMWAKIYVLDG